jgi:thiamine-phosphate pyrophosphorylase
VTEAVDNPVYALGGICEEKIPECIKAGAEGVCMMSEYMGYRG